jgi:small-conductance mechanosensitive channel
VTLRFRRSFIFVLSFAALTVPTAQAVDPISAATPGPRAGSASAGEISEAEIGTPTAPVTLDGVTLFKVRGVSAFPAEQRAGAIAGRVQAVAADATVSADALRVVEAEHGSEIRAVDQLVMTVLDADARIEGIDRRLLAEAYRRRIASAMTAYRQDRSASVLMASAGYSLGATLLLGIVLWTLYRLYQRLDATMEQRFKTRFHALKIKSYEILQTQQMWRALHAGTRTFGWLLAATSIYLYLHFVLSLYPWTRPFAQHLLDLLLKPLVALGVGLLAAIPDLLIIAILVVITRYLLRLIHAFFTAAAGGQIVLSGFDPEWAWPTYRIIRLLIVAFAVVVAYPYVPGSGSNAFKGVSIFLGVIFSLGSSSVIANIIAGYTMTYRRAYRIGDRIKVGDLMGDVIETRIMVTHLRTPKNEEIVVPNSMILNSHVINYSSLARTQGLILHTPVGIGYETPWRQVEAMLIQAAERTPGLLSKPEPFVLEKSLGDFCVTYELNVYCDKASEMLQLYALLHQNILDAFNEHGVQIMTPAYERDPAQPKIVPKEQWFAAPARAPAGGADTPHNGRPGGISEGA